MTKRFQFGWMAVTLIGAMALSAAAARAEMTRPAQNHTDRPPQRQQAPAPRPPSQPAARPNTSQQNANRPPAGQTQRQAGGTAQHQPIPQHQPNNGSNRPPNSMSGPPPSHFNNRPNEYHNNRPYENGPGTTLRPRQQVGVGAPRPFVDRMDHLNPQQRADLRAKEDTWRRMTPEQRSYVKKDVLPRWRQIPWERQQVIQQKLGVLQNMPESARNRRLSDPNFTRGMSDDDRQTLHDLSHLHVGGAPDPPGNE